MDMVANNRISAVLVSTDLERTGIGRSAWFKDPDGNTIALFQPE